MQSSAKILLINIKLRRIDQTNLITVVNALKKILYLLNENETKKTFRTCFTNKRKLVTNGGLKLNMSKTEHFTSLNANLTLYKLMRN